MEEKSIFISEIGTVSPLGKSLEEVEQALDSSERCIADVQTFPYHSFEKPIPCYRLKGIDAVSILGKKGLRNKDEATKMLLCAAELGFKTLLEGCPEERRPGLCIGTAFGSLESIGDFLSDSIVNGVNAVNPQSFANTVINAPTGNANIRYGLRNLSSTLSTGFNSGLDAVIYASDLLRSGYFEQIIAGGFEEISYYSLLGFLRGGLLANSCQVRPFSSDSRGVVLGEGCALFLLETAESVRNRNAVPIAEIAGCANGFDPAAAGTAEANDGSVYKQVVLSACEQARIDPDSIDFIASGASGNKRGDALEAAGIASVFGTKTPVVSYKAFTGECYGASGAISILCALADMNKKRVHGIPYSPYPVISSINVVFGVLEKAADYVLVSSYSCDGNCSAVIIRKC